MPPMEDLKNAMADHDLLVRCDEKLNYIVMTLKEHATVLEKQDGRISSLERKINFFAGVVAVIQIAVVYFLKH